MPPILSQPAFIAIAQILILFVLAQLIQRQLSSLLMNIINSQKWTVALIALAFWPGTLVHELAHLIAARLLLVPAGRLTLIPQIKANRIVMGQVSLPQVDPLRMSLIAIAPFIVGLTSLYFLLSYFAQNQPDQWWKTALFYYAIIQLSNTLFLSAADWRATRRLLILAALALTLAYIFDWLPTLDQTITLITNQNHLWQAITQSLQLPLLINAILLLSLTLTKQASPK